jgi:hypothetical protein
MTTVKHISTNYVVSTPTGVGSNITLRSDSVFIDGNLVVTGQTTQVDTINATIEDNVITVNQGETGPGVSLGVSGLAVDRGTLPDVSVLWNEPLGFWQLTTDGYSYDKIITSADTGLFSVHSDPAPWLGGNLNLGGYTVFSNVGNLNFTGNLEISYQASAPTAVGNATVVYASTPGPGGSGLHAVTSAGDDELVTRTRAILYAMVL